MTRCVHLAGTRSRYYISNPTVIRARACYYKRTYRINFYFMLRLYRYKLRIIHALACKFETLTRPRWRRIHGVLFYTRLFFKRLIGYDQHCTVGTWWWWWWCTHTNFSDRNDREFRYFFFFIDIATSSIDE